MSTRAFGLGLHLDGQICRVGCSFCYLGARGENASRERTLAPDLLREVIATLPPKGPFGEVAVAVSEPARRWRPGLVAIAEAAAARGLPLTITTTPAVVAADPWVLDGARRVSFSLDPAKSPGGGGLDLDLDLLGRALAHARGLETIGLVSVVSPDFAAKLAGGLLAELLDEDRGRRLGAVALNALKPPPPWCDRAFWLRFVSHPGVRPLLERHLNRRLHLDCYVGARLLGLGGCPAKPDVSPGREFRACVYQAAPDFVFADGAELARRTADYAPPAACPFAIS